MLGFSVNLCELERNRPRTSTSFDFTQKYKIIGYLLVIQKNSSQFVASK